MSNHRLVYRYTWKDGVPSLLWRRNNGRGNHGETPLRGRLRIGIGEKRCIGFRQARQQLPCPDEARPTGKQCVACQQRDTFRPCMTCNGFRCPPLSPSVQRSCEQTHHLYLASFGGPEIKVGTASHPRRQARLVDQGPLVAVRIAMGPGPKIKQLEHIASTRTAAVEGMRRTRKQALLSSSMTEAEAHRLVLSALADLRAVAGPEYTELFVPPDRYKPPLLARDTRALIRGAVSLPVELNARIEGDVLGAIGHVAVLQDPTGRYLLDLGDLVGRLIDPNPSSDTKRPTVQLGFF